MTQPRTVRGGLFKKARLCGFERETLYSNIAPCRVSKRFGQKWNDSICLPLTRIILIRFVDFGSIWRPLSLTSILGSWASSSSSLLRILADSFEPLVLVVRRVRRPSNGWIQISRLSPRLSIRAASDVAAAAASRLRLLLASLASRRFRSCCSYCSWEKRQKTK